jgi:cytoskeletal protein CcmA (bactofilin family)
MKVVFRPEAPGHQLSPADQTQRTLTLALEKEGIAMVIPESAVFDGKLYVRGGVMILGHFSGEIISTRGSVIIAASGSFAGRLEAYDIYVEGKVGDPSKAAADSALLTARHKVSLSKFADVQAIVQAPNFYNPEGALMHSSIVKILAPMPRRQAA